MVGEAGLPEEILVLLQNVPNAGLRAGPLWPASRRGAAGERTVP